MTRTGDRRLAFVSADVGYGRTTIVSGASLDVRAGEVVGLVGPNGAGKSTLLRAVTATADVLGGHIELAGASLASLSPMQRARIVAVVPQTVTAAFALSASEFVMMGRHPHIGRFEGESAADDEIVETAMRRTDTARLAERPVDELSGGDLQRLALAQALTQQPSVLLLDEPTSHLDLNHRLQVLDLVRELAEGGLAVLAVFHDLDLAARYSDRLAIVSAGRLGAAMRPEDVLTAEAVREVFGVRSVISTDPVTGSVIVTPVVRDAAVASASEKGRVFVVAGSGSGASLMRRLALEGWNVSVAALNSGDVDAGVADALGLEFPHLPPYAPIDEGSRDAAALLAEQAGVIVVCDVPFGRANLANLEVAVRAGRPLVLVGRIEGRDFAGGRAAELLAEAISGGARIVSSASDVAEALEAIVREGGTTATREENA